MKQYLTKGALALVLGGCLTSCSHEEFDISTYVADKVKAYEQVFVSEFGSIDPDQDWGFGSSANNSEQARRMTRAVFADHWDGIHNSTSSSKVPCGVNWTDTIQYTMPSGLVTVGADTKISPNNNYYVPATFNGKVEFADNYNGNIYVAGTVTGYEGGNQQTVNIYILENGSWKNSFTSGTITFYNNGYLTLDDADLQNSNIKAIYNAGSFKYDGAGKNTNSSTYLYSTGTVELTADNVDFKLICDIHNTMYAKNVKIQNSTPKYICGIEATGKVENVDGPLVTSNVVANELSFDGNPIYLTQGGHINVGTLKVPNSNSHVYAVTGSTALVEAINFEFGNKNDFTHTFSDNIYFKVNGGYIQCDNCFAMGHSHYFINVDQYLASNAHASDNQTDEYALAADRINAGDASGSPACGKAWSIGAGSGSDEVEIPTDKSETTGNTIKVVTTKQFYKTTELVEPGRVFCEDLGQISSNDLDFNDVVFDAYVYSVTPSTVTIVEEDGVEVSRETVYGEPTYKTAIVLLAAGGTLDLNLAGVEVHNSLGQNPTSTIINTITNDGESYRNQWTTNVPVVLGEDFSYSSIAEIPIVVRYGNGQILELTAEKGWAPHKILVPIGTKWCKERVNIADAYKSFNDYVGTSKYFWEGEIDETKLYPSEVTYVLTTITGTVPDGPDEVIYSERGDGETTTGGYQGEEVLSRERR